MHFFLLWKVKIKNFPAFRISHPHRLQQNSMLTDHMAHSTLSEYSHAYLFVSSVWSSGLFAVLSTHSSCHTAPFDLALLLVDLMASLFFPLQSWDKSLSHQKALLHRKQDNKKTKKCCSDKLLKVKRLIYVPQCVRLSQMGSNYSWFLCILVYTERCVLLATHAGRVGGRCTCCHSGMMPDACYNMHPWCCTHFCFLFFWEETSTLGHHQNGRHFP